MRVYIPVVVSDFQAAHISPRRVHAVTPQAHAHFPQADQESLEMLATLYAADDSLLLLRSAAHQENRNSERARRCVAVGEVPAEWVSSTESSEEEAELDVIDSSDKSEEIEEAPPTSQTLITAVPWEVIESIHVDEPGSEELVARAIAGDDDAFEATGDIELLWYDVVEKDLLARELRSTQQVEVGK